MNWYKEAPSNIALIKYMGKRPDQTNFPENPSFSYTLPHLRSMVRLEKNEGGTDQWRPWPENGISLTPRAQLRFLSHLQRIKTYFQVDTAFTLYSNNNFPLGVGIASSASSFAALTQCAVAALTQLTARSELSTLQQAQLSRLGSGSSCRSFYAPWCVWEGEKVYALDTPYSTLIHQVVVFSPEEKSVSSSEAHQRVLSSPLYPERNERALRRLEKLITAMQQQEWREMYRICFDEFMDMHQLFETANPAFHYQTAEGKQVLAELQAHWKTTGDGPLITMDAGSSIHLLYRPDQEQMAQSIQQSILAPYAVF